MTKKLPWISIHCMYFIQNILSYTLQKHAYMFIVFLGKKLHEVKCKQPCASYYKMKQLLMNIAQNLYYLDSLLLINPKML